jgi:hypothetical protein
MPRRVGLVGVFPDLAADADDWSHADSSVSVREWFELFLASSNVSQRDRTIALRLADGESVRAVARHARMSPQRVQQIGDALAQRFGVRYRTSGALALDLGGNRRELLCERGRCTTAAELGRRRNGDRKCRPVQRRNRTTTARST